MPHSAADSTDPSRSDRAEVFALRDAQPGVRRPLWPRPAFVVALLWIGGLILGRTLAWPAWSAPGFVLAALLFHALLLSRSRRHPRAHPPPRGGWILAAFTALGMAQGAQIAAQDNEAAQIAHWAESLWTVTVEGTLAEEPEGSEEGIRLTLDSPCFLETETRAHPLHAGIRIYERSRLSFPKAGSAPDESASAEVGKPARSVPPSVAAQCNRMARGDRVRAIGVFRAVGLEPRNPGASAPGGAQAAQAIAGTLIVQDIADLYVAPPDGGRSLWARGLHGLAQWRRAALDSFERECGPAAGPVLAAVVLGDTSRLSPDQARDFRRTGLAHLFSVSGIHAAILGGALYLALLLMGIPPRPRMIGVVAGIAVYAALTGFQVPVLRTWIMVAALCAQPFLRRPVDALSRLAAAALVIALLWPRAVFHVGFQLSFLAVFTLITFQPFLERLFQHGGGEERRGWRAWLALRSVLVARAVLTLVVLQIAVAPLLARLFQEVSLIAPLANLLVLPLATLTLWLGAAQAGPGLLIPGLDTLLGPLAALAADATLALTHTLARIPGASRVAPAFAPLTVLLWYALLFGGAHLRFGRGPGHWARQRAAFGVHALALAALALCAPFMGRWLQPDRLRVTFLDVGQGDAILVETPRGDTLLVDAGPPWPEGGPRWHLLPALRSRGHSVLDLAIATHADADHIGGFPYLFDEFALRRMAFMPAASAPPLWQAIERRMRQEGVSAWDMHEGCELTGSDPRLRLRVLNPPAGARSETADRNTESVVLRLDYGRFSLLLTGDADSAAEERILKKHGADAVRATVLKAGHHGSPSSTSEAFLGAVAPSLVVFSCGRANPYGHPAPGVVERCRVAGARIHRTDQGGALVVETDGRTVWLTPWLSVRRVAQ